MPAGPWIGLSGSRRSGPAGLRLDPHGDPLADRLVYGGVAHHSTLADFLGAGLELRLDQRHQGGPVAGERERRRQQCRQPDKARIAGDQIDRLGDFGTCQIARVEPFMHVDPLVLAQFPGELTAPDIDRVDPGGTARQQHVGETAGRGADVERDSRSVTSIAK